MGHSRGRRSPGPRPRTPGDRRTAPHTASGGGGAGVSDDNKECRLLPATRFHRRKTATTNGSATVNIANITELVIAQEEIKGGIGQIYRE